MRYGEAGRALGTHGNNLRYAALTGTLAIRWEGARLPVVWTCRRRRSIRQRRPASWRAATCTSSVRRGAAGSRSGRAIGVRKAVRAFDELAAELMPVLTPSGDAWLLAGDEATMREPPQPAAAARFLPSGDAYTLGITSDDRALLLPDAGQRGELWTPRVWPGALLVAGKVVGTWRRAQRNLTIQTWQKLTPPGARGGRRRGRIVAAA